MSELTFNVDGPDETVTVHVLPARYAVCDECEGHGTHLTPSIREHVYTQEDMEEAGEEFREEYLRRGGIYDVECAACKGFRVVLVPDEARCEPATLALYVAMRAAEEREARVRAAELRMGA